VDILIKNTAIDKKESLPGQQVIIILLLNKLRGLKAGPLCEEPVRGNIFRRKDYLDFPSNRIPGLWEALPMIH
jgi:hypothetical protein